MLSRLDSPDLSQPLHRCSHEFADSPWGIASTASHSRQHFAVLKAALARVALPPDSSEASASGDLWGGADLDSSNPSLEPRAVAEGTVVDWPFRSKGTTPLFLSDEQRRRQLQTECESESCQEGRASRQGMQRGHFAGAENGGGACSVVLSQLRAAEICGEEAALAVGSHQRIACVETRPLSEETQLRLLSVFEAHLTAFVKALGEAALPASLPLLLRGLKVLKKTTECSACAFQRPSKVAFLHACDVRLSLTDGCFLSPGETSASLLRRSGGSGVPSFPAERPFRFE